MTVRAASRLGSAVTLLALAVGPGVAQVPDSLNGARYGVLQGRRATLGFAAQDSLVAERVLSLLDDQTPLPGLGVDDPAGVVAVLAHDDAAFDELTGGSVPEWRAGVAIPARNMLVIPIGQGPRILDSEGRTTLRHEWAHLGLHGYLGDLRVPRWFDEGYAQVASGGFDAMEAWRLRVLIATGRAPAMDSLALGWPTGQEDARTAYLLAASAVSYLLSESGERGLTIFLGRWRDGRSFEDALRATYGVTTGQFEEDWRKHVKQRYGWLFVLSHSAIFWALLTLMLLFMVRTRRVRNRERLAHLRADEIPDEPAYWEPPSAGDGPEAAPPGDTIVSMSPETSQRILVVDDDTDGLEVLKTRLVHAGYEVETAASAEKALACLKAFDPGLVVTDVRMSGMSGLEFLERVRKSTQQVEVVVMTAHDDMETAVTAMKSGAFDFLVKPVDPKTVLGLAERCFRERELAVDWTVSAEEIDALPRGQLVGRTPRMIEIYKTIGSLARNRATVLVRGETGTGKEVIARAIHQHSVHAKEPFIAVNCTALTDTLLETELFGHVKGAFTGAVGTRKGYFELAGKGTIFLDEIGDTSPEFQTKLLRVLQERRFYPVGGEQPRTTEARVIAATHQPIEQLVAEGRFREDLYFRLKVVEIHVPPLRERAADIEALANALLGRIRAETGRDVRRISDDAVVRLTGYRWPGNVRELENALLRAAIMARGTVIGPDHLILGDEEDGAADLSLAAAVRRHVRSVLGTAGGDRAVAARLLGIDETDLDHHLAPD